MTLFQEGHSTDCGWHRPQAAPGNHWRSRLNITRKKAFMLRRFGRPPVATRQRSGILGAVLGLIHVMENLADPSKLGGGIAVAFVATVHGVGLANLFFLPLPTR